MVQRPFLLLLWAVIPWYEQPYVAAIGDGGGGVRQWQTSEPGLAPGLWGALVSSIDEQMGGWPYSVLSFRWSVAALDSASLL